EAAQQLAEALGDARGLRLLQHHLADQDGPRVAGAAPREVAVLHRVPVEQGGADAPKARRLTGWSAAGHGEEPSAPVFRSPELWLRYPRPPMPYRLVCLDAGFTLLSP